MTRADAIISVLAGTLVFAGWTIASTPECPERRACATYQGDPPLPPRWAWQEVRAERLAECALPCEDSSVLAVVDARGEEVCSCSDVWRMAPSGYPWSIDVVVTPQIVPDEDAPPLDGYPWSIDGAYTLQLAPGEWVQVPIVDEPPRCLDLGQRGWEPCSP